MVLTCSCTYTQEEGYTAEDAETMELPDPEAASAAAANDPFVRLERGQEDGARGRRGAERLAELRDDARAKFAQDYAINKALRRQLRCVRARIAPHVWACRWALHGVLSREPGCRVSWTRATRFSMLEASLGAPSTWFPGGTECSKGSYLRYQECEEG